MWAALLLVQRHAKKHWTCVYHICLFIPYSYIVSYSLLFDYHPCTSYRFCSFSLPFTVSPICWHFSHTFLLTVIRLVTCMYTTYAYLYLCLINHVTSSHNTSNTSCLVQAYIYMCFICMLVRLLFCRLFFCFTLLGFYVHSSFFTPYHWILYCLFLCCINNKKVTYCNLCTFKQLACLCNTVL